MFVHKKLKKNIFQSPTQKADDENEYFKTVFKAKLFKLLNQREFYLKLLFVITML